MQATGTDDVNPFAIMAKGEDRKEEETLMTAETVNMDAAAADVIRRVEDYLAAHEEVSREQFAKMAGISGGALSSFLKGKYQGAWMWCRRRSPLCSKRRRAAKVP